MHDVCCVCEVGTYSITSGAYIHTVPIIQWLCGSVSSVQCTVCVCSVHMFVCCVHFSETVAHTNACSCRVFTLL